MEGLVCPAWLTGTYGACVGLPGGRSQSSGTRCQLMEVGFSHYKASAWFQALSNTNVHISFEDRAGGIGATLPGLNSLGWPGEPPISDIWEP